MSDSPDQCPPPETPPPVPPADERPQGKKHKRNGKVAQLPKAVRDKLNRMLDDGLTYKQAIAGLGDDGKHLNEDNIGNWYKEGFQDWLKERPCLDEWRAKWEFADDLVAQGHGLNIHQMVNQFLANHVHEAISELPKGLLLDALRNDPKNIIHLIQAFPRLTEAEVQCVRQKAESERKRAETVDKKAGKRAIQPETQKHIETQFNLK
jgi:hypothetical protein